ncbi:glycosyltransferase [Acidimicrobiales bacterium]|nr:glycosyltransferase [Acidimicrobiales bacterium]
MDARIDQSLQHARKLIGRVHLRSRRAVASRLVNLQRRTAGKQSERPGVTVATVTWNSLPYLKVLIEAVHQFSDPTVELLVIDNHSTDGTKEFLEAQSEVRSVMLPMNIGHGLGLDIAMIQAKTEHVIALDVDAFPIVDTWLDSVLGPLSNGATVAGAHFHRSFIHPCFLAMRRRDFLDLGVTFAPIGIAPTFGSAPKRLFMDVGEALSHNVSLANGSKALHRVPLTSSQGPGVAGSVFGDVVYHNFYSTQGRPDLMAASEAMWQQAVATYLRPFDSASSA